MRGAKISTRYEVGVLKILHDMCGGAKILHDYQKNIFLQFSKIRDCLKTLGFAMKLY